MPILISAHVAPLSFETYVEETFEDSFCLAVAHSQPFASK